MDVTVVGSGPNGLAAAVICARAGLSVRVVEAQPTAGGGARTAADPEFPGGQPRRLLGGAPVGVVSPFFAEFDLAARGVRLVGAGDVLRQPAAGQTRGGRLSLDWTARAPNSTTARRGGGSSGRSPTTSTACSGFFLGDKRSLPPELLTTVRTGLRVLAQGSPAWSLLRGEDARALFTGVGAHAISRMPSPVNSGAGLMLGDGGAHGGLAGADRWDADDRRRADRRPAGPRRRVGARRTGHHAARRGGASTTPRRRHC